MTVDTEYEYRFNGILELKQYRLDLTSIRESAKIQKQLKRENDTLKKTLKLRSMRR